MNTVYCDVCGKEIENADPEMTIIPITMGDPDDGEIRFLQVAVCDEEDEATGQHFCKQCLLTKLQEDGPDISGENWAEGIDLDSAYSGDDSSEGEGEGELEAEGAE